MQIQFGLRRRGELEPLARLGDAGEVDLGGQSRSLVSSELVSGSMSSCKSRCIDRSVSRGDAWPSLVGEQEGEAS